MKERDLGVALAATSGVLDRYAERLETLKTVVEKVITETTDRHAAKELRDTLREIEEE